MVLFEIYASKLLNNSIYKYRMFSGCIMCVYMYYKKSLRCIFRETRKQFPLSWIEHRGRLLSSDGPTSYSSFSLARSLSHVHGLRDCESSHGLFACSAYSRLFTLTPRRRRINETRLFVDAALSLLAWPLRNSKELFNLKEYWQSE